MADYAYLDNTGLIVPDTSTLQTEVENEFKAVFGQDLIVTANTPQGVLIAAEVTARSAVLRNNAAVANQINPNLAGGIFLDAIWELTGGGRIAATRSVVPGAVLLGLPGTFVGAGAQASLSDGTVFESVADVTLDSLGTATVDFQAVDAGPIAVNANALNQVVTSVLGWDSISNPNAATLGRLQGSDLSSRTLRKNTLSVQNVSLPEAVTSGLYATNNVRSLSFRENNTNATATIDGISLGPHSIYVCVDGGTDTDVAATLLKHKSLGSGWNGTTVVDTVDPASGQTYEVKFDRPTTVQVKTRLTVRNIGALIDVSSAVRQAIIDFAAGNIEGEAGFTVGSNVSAFELAGAVNQQNPGVYVQKCETSLTSITSWGTDEIAVGLNQIAAIQSGDIEVTIL